MINIDRAMHSNRIMKSLTGLNIEKFKEIVPYFEIVLLEDTKQRIKSDVKRVRAKGAGKKHTLKSIEEKLFYILFYLKVYPTFDLSPYPKRIPT
jgi:hypothetical protein